MLSQIRDLAKKIRMPTLVGTNRYVVRELRKQNRQLREAMVNIQETTQRYVDVLSGTEIGSSVVTGNAYTDRRTMVDATISKYKNKDSWGSLFVQRIVNVRKAMVMPHGLSVQTSGQAEEAISNDKLTKEKVQEAKDVILKFLDENDLNEGTAIGLAQEGEVQGGVLVDLKNWDKEKKTVTMIYRPWAQFEYEIKVEPENPGKIKTVTWADQGEAGAPGDGKIKGETLKADELAFVYFNGLMNEFEGIPTTGSVLTTLEDLHMILKNWYRFNTLYGKATPVFEVETRQEADRINYLIQSKKWGLGLAIAIMGKFSYAVPDAGPVREILEHFIRMSLQIVAGHTGVGPHFLGIPEVMSNRSTAESMGEPTELVAVADIVLWRGFYEDVFYKVIAKHNAEMNMQVEQGLVKPQLLPMTDRAWDRAVQFWLPAKANGLVSEELFLENIPGIDAQRELRQSNREEVRSQLDFSGLDEFEEE